MTDLRAIAGRLGGEVSGEQVLCPGPGHGPRDRSLSIRFQPNSDFIVSSFAGDDWRDCRDYVRERLGLGDRRGQRREATKRQARPAPRPDDGDRSEFALRLWREAVPIAGTLGARYFCDQRSLDISGLDLSHVLRFHGGIRAVVALMTDPKTNEATGVHRTYLDAGGKKTDRKMLGKAGVIRLCPDDSVTLGLGICEGIEDGIAIILSGWRPVWAAASAGLIQRFPVLAGIEALTIFADADDTGMRAAYACAGRWREAGRECVVVAPETAGAP